MEVIAYRVQFLGAKGEAQETSAQG